MDAIESMDWGAYAHFRFTGQQFPPAVRMFATIYHPQAIFFAALIIWALAVFAFLVQGRRREGIITLCTYLAGGGVLLATWELVPRRRPPDAQPWVGADHMIGSYPSMLVFLVLLSFILLGMALWRPMRTWMRAVYILLAALMTVAVCMSELFLCLHFVTDLIGAIVGAALLGVIAGRLMAAVELPAKKS